jgi:hypothetical protein
MWMCDMIGHVEEVHVVSPSIAKKKAHVVLDIPKKAKSSNALIIQE